MVNHDIIRMLVRFQRNCYGNGDDIDTICRLLRTFQDCNHCDTANGNTKLEWFLKKYHVDNDQDNTKLEWTLKRY